MRIEWECWTYAVYGEPFSDQMDTRAMLICRGYASFFIMILMYVDMIRSIFDLLSLFYDLIILCSDCINPHCSADVGSRDMVWLSYSYAYSSHICITWLVFSLCHGQFTSVYKDSYLRPFSSVFIRWLKSMYLISVSYISSY